MATIHPATGRARRLWLLLWWLLMALTLWELILPLLPWKLKIGEAVRPSYLLSCLLQQHPSLPSALTQAVPWTGVNGIFGIDLSRGQYGYWHIEILLTTVTLFTALLFVLCLGAFTFNRPTLARLAEHRPLTSVQQTIAALMAGMLATAACWLLLDVLNLWYVIYRLLPHPVYSQPQLSNVRWQYYQVPQLGWLGPSLLGVSFLIALLLMTLMRQRDEECYWKIERLSRCFVLAALLLLGWAVLQTLLGEAEDAYQGTYTAGLLGTFVLLWSFGVRARLLQQWPAYQQVKLQTPAACTDCGYDLRGTILAGRSECPECGHKIIV